MQEIVIGPHVIGPSHRPFIIAELSGNHNHSLDQAFQLVKAAKDAGAHAVKLQTFTPDTITLDLRKEEFLIQDPDSLWHNRYLYELYAEAFLPWEWHEPIFKRCKELGILGFSTPFDETAVDFLESLEVPCYKIASPEIVDHELIRKVAETGKPVILSTGASSLSEIGEAVSVAQAAGCQNLILLKCTAAYPASPKDANLRTIPHLRDSFGTLVGLSDHSLGIGVALASIALGACVIEKHLTLSRNAKGVDSSFSMEPHEFESLVVESERAWQSLGDVCYAPAAAELTTRSHRPSLYFVQDLPAGTLIQPAHIRSVRPGKGLPPKEYSKVLGLVLTQNVDKGTPVTWEVFKGSSKTI
jgi:pseudaminic acid synthase